MAARKLRFSVVHATGSDNDYPAEELNVHSPQTKGWQSECWCSFPQELGLALDGRCLVYQLQLLSHQAKIAKKLEVFIGDGRTYHEASWTRLGYFSLNSNQRSQFKARELKTVSLDAAGRFLRLKILGCHVNALNHQNQVGFIAINIVGEAAPELDAGFGSNHQLDGATQRASGALLPSDGATESSVAPDAARKSANPTSNTDQEVDARTMRLLRGIDAAKSEAVAGEDYERAKRLKALHSKLLELGSKLHGLELSKRTAVADEDFDKALAVKAQIDATVEEMGPIEERARDEGAQPIAEPAPTPMQPQQPQHAPSQTQQMQHEMPQHASQQVQQQGFDEQPVGAAARGGGHMPPEPAASLPPGSGPDPGHGPEGNPMEVPLGGGGRGGSGMGMQQADPMEVPLGGGGGGGMGGMGGMGGLGSADDGGQHPLSGAEGIEGDALPDPEPLQGGELQMPEFQSILGVFGEYILRCLLSRTPKLRQAAVRKAVSMLPSLQQTPGMALAAGGAGDAVCEMIKIAAGDNVPGVFDAALSLLNDALPLFVSAGVSAQELQSRLEPVASSLLSKVADNNKQISQRAADGALSLAQQRALGGVGFVGALALRPMPKRQAANWKPLKSRLDLLRRLAKDAGLITSGSGVDVVQIIEFVKSVGAINHSQGAARDACMQLCAVLHAQAPGDVDRALDGVLGDQLQERYARAFEEEADMLPTGATDGSGYSRMHEAEDQFRDLIMNKLEEHASSVDTAYAIMQDEFVPRGRGPSTQGGASDELRLNVLIDWASEAGLETCTFDTLQRGGAELDDLLHRMAQWLFNV